MFLAFFLITKVIKSRETLVKKIIFNMIEFKDNNDKKSSNNIENLNFAVMTVITVVVNVAVNVII